MPPSVLRAHAPRGPLARPLGARRQPLPARRRGGAPVMVLPDGIVLQGFHWESSTPDARDPSAWPGGVVSSSWYDTVRAKAADMRRAGITDVWLPPPSSSVSREGYLPTSLYDLGSAYGSAAELRELLGELGAQGVGAVLDVVFNHRCGDRQNEDGKWILFSDELAHDNRRLDWGPWALVSNHPDPDLAGTGAPKDEIVYAAAPNVDHSNPEVREALISWLNYMTRPRNFSFSSLRFDFVLGYAAKYVKEYVDATVYPRGELCIAEYWNDGGIGDPGFTTPEMLAEYADAADGHFGCFDFPLKTAIHKAALTEDWSLLGSAEGGLPGLMGIRPHLAFTFIDNHDTSAPQTHYPFPDSVPKLLAAYTYTLSHPGIPCIFWLHLYGKKNAAGITNGVEPDVSLTEQAGRIDLRGCWVPPNNPGYSWEERWPGKEPWSIESQDGVQGPIYTGLCGEEIKKMSLARSQAGVHSTSKVEVIESRKDLYQACITGRTAYGSSRSGASDVDFVHQLMVAIGPDAKAVPQQEGWTLVSSGSLHAMFALKTAVAHSADAALDEEHPHTYRANSDAVPGGKEPAAAAQEFF